MRLDRLLANLGYGSRREMQMLARAGLVTLDGAALSLSAKPKASRNIGRPARATRIAPSTFMA